METERIGPLSYSLEQPSGEYSAERPIIIGTVATLVAAVVACVLGWLAHGVVGNRKLVLWCGVLGVWAAGLAVAWFLSPGRARRRRNALAGVAVAAMVISYGVYVVLDISRPSITQLRYAIGGFDLPRGWTLISDTDAGNRRCEPQCPRVELVYRAPEGTKDPGREVIRALLSQGWTQKDQNVTPDAATAAFKDRVLADIFAAFEGPDVRIVLKTNSTGSTEGGD